MKKSVSTMVVSFATIALFAGVAQAKSMEIPDAASRLQYIREGSVWERPAWINDDFSFAAGFRLTDVDDSSDIAKVVSRDLVECTNTGEKVTFNGKTPKFMCELKGLAAKKSGKEAKPKTIKFKYIPPGGENGEIWGEMIGTRILTALGFGSDEEFYTKVNCYGCTDHPFKHPEVDQSTLVNPRPFVPVAVELKHKGIEMDMGTTQGFDASELLTNLSTDPERAKSQKVERDALRLMMAFMQHADDKTANQRMVCLNTDDKTGATCTGKVLLFLQDVGSTFGKGLENPFVPNRADFAAWAKTPVWKNPATCEGRLQAILTGDHKSVNPTISEDGRMFLAKLLDGLVRGTEGRNRLVDLFKSIEIDQRGGSPEQWADLFIRKVEEVKFPMGPNHPEFKCPR
jgi:hypothetical protein